MNREPLGSPIDARGRRVPRKLVGPFITRARLFRLTDKLNEVRTELAQMNLSERVLDSLPMADIYASFNFLNTAILENAPAIPCGCSPNIDCEYCKGKRWLNATDIRRITSTSQPADSSEK